MKSRKTIEPAAKLSRDERKMVVALQCMAYGLACTSLDESARTVEAQFPRVAAAIRKESRAFLRAVRPKNHKCAWCINTRAVDLRTAEGEQKLITLWQELSGLAEALGVAPINNLPGCWTVELDSSLWLAINGHLTEKGATTPAGHNVSVGAGLALIVCDGLPVGMLFARGATLREGLLDKLIVSARAKRESLHVEPPDQRAMRSANPPSQTVH